MTETTVPGAPSEGTAIFESPGVSLIVQIESAIRGGKVALPVLPEVAIKVRELIANEGRVHEIVALIEREPSFAAAVLRYANSVAYAGLKEITDLKHAVTRMGLTAVEQTILAIAARHAFRASSPQDEQNFRMLWRHSVVTALAARRLAVRAPGLGPELAFLSGLLHDVGKVVILHCVADFRRKDPNRFALSEAAVSEFFDSLHCQVGDTLAEVWNLPKEIRAVIRRHHDSSFPGPDDLLVAIVAFANDMASKMGASLHPNPDLSLLDSPAAVFLKLDDVRLAGLMVDVEDDIARVQEALL